MPIVNFCCHCERALWLARDPRRVGLVRSELEGHVKAAVCHLDQLVPGQPVPEQARKCDGCFKPLTWGWSPTQRCCARRCLTHFVCGFVC